MGRLERQVLLCDADDTLWENNGYFLDALVRFLDLVEKKGVERLAAEKKLREVEAVRTKSAGYGSLNYAISLCDTWELLLGPMPAAVRQEVEDLGRKIYEHAIELLPGVHETVSELAGRHELWIVTKGHYEEQLVGLAERDGVIERPVAGRFRPDGLDLAEFLFRREPRDPVGFHEIQEAHQRVQEVTVVLPERVVRVAKQRLSFHPAHLGRGC